MRLGRVFLTVALTPFAVGGTYELTMNDASGKPVNDRGRYVEVWEKQADGKWKCGTDIWNSDLPVATAEKK